MEEMTTFTTCCHKTRLYISTFPLELFHAETEDNSLQLSEVPVIIVHHANPNRKESRLRGLCPC